MLANFLWIFQLNASGTGRLLGFDSLRVDKIDRQDCSLSTDLDSKISISCSKAKRNSCRNSNRDFMAFFTVVSIASCLSIQEIARSKSVVKSPESKCGSNDRL